MTEQEWLANLPSLMMQHVSAVSPASPRKLRLLAVAYARFLESKPEYADAKHVSHLGEEVAEGHRTLNERWDDRVRGWGYDGDWSIANLVLAGDDQIEMAFRKAWWFAEDRGRRAGVDVADRQTMARSLILCVLGNPFQPVPTLAPDWLRWNEAMVVRLAQSIYDDRGFDRLPILADALEDAGCTDNDILNRCWAVDLLLGKE
jgi:hypothetical protein